MTRFHRGSAIALALFGSTICLAQDPLFQAGKLVPVPTPASILVADDFNADGRPDVALVSSTRSQISVQLQTGELAFGAPAVYDVGLGPLGIAGGDLNRDGAIDLVVVNSGASTLAVLLNQGDGTFGARTEFPVGQNPRAVRLADFDRDGVPDAATSDLVSTLRGSVTVLLADGEGGFRDGSELIVGDNPHSLVTGDFDGDGLVDVASPHTRAFSYFRGLGDGTFAARVATGLGQSNPRLSVSGDFNEDGISEVVVLSDQKDIFFLEHGEDGIFEVALIGEGHSSPISGVLAPSDFNGDGHLDVMTAALGGRGLSFSLRILEGAGNGEFLPPIDVPVGVTLASAIFADLDGDGDRDLLGALSGSPELVVAVRDASESLGLHTVLPLEELPRDLAASDVDRDGRTDIVALSSSGLHVALSDGRGGFEEMVVHALEAHAVQHLLAGDFDGDGEDELAISELAESTIIVVDLDADGQPAGDVRHPAGVLPGQPVAGDFDADGRIDLAVPDLAAASIRVLFAPGAANATASDVEVDAVPTTLAAGDIDGDGHVDLAAGTRETGAVLYGDGRGDFSRRAELPELTLAEQLLITDVDADRAADVVGAFAGSRITILYAAAREPRRREDPQLERRPLRIDVADLDRDGSRDLVAMGRSTVFALRGMVDGSFGTPELYLAGLSLRHFFLEDLDGDTWLDLAAADVGMNAVSLLRGVVSSAAEPGFRRGDADLDGGAKITDAVVILENLFGGRGALACPDAADTNDDGAVNLADAVWLLGFLFQGTAAPPVPGPDECGTDPTEDDLDCAEVCP